MYIDAQVFLTIVAVISGIGVFVGIFVKIHKFVLKQDELEKRIDELQAKEERDKESLQKQEQSDIDRICFQHEKDLREIMCELHLHTRAILACLEVLSDSDKTGAVQTSIKEIKDHLYEKAHD